MGAVAATLAFLPGGTARRLLLAEPEMSLEEVQQGLIPPQILLHWQPPGPAAAVATAAAVVARSGGTGDGAGGAAELALLRLMIVCMDRMLLRLMLTNAFCTASVIL